MQHNQKLNIVCHAFPSWNDEYLKSTIQLMKELAIHHNVVYIDYAYTLKDILTSKTNNNIRIGNILGIDSTYQVYALDNGASITVVSLPPVIPTNWMPANSIFNVFNYVNNSLVRKRIRSTLNKIKFTPDVIVNAFNPLYMKSTFELFPECKVIYYCYDNLGAMCWANKHGAKAEKEILLKADCVVFSSDQLEKTKKTNSETVVITNGVDLTNFKTISNRSKPNVRKIIGYTGSVDNRLDYELLSSLIQSNPHMDFHFVGKLSSEKGSELKKFPNVIFSGARPAKDLPEIMAKFDLGIIPFLKNEFTSNIYPMKVNEYLSLGIPVVMTDFAELKDLRDVVTTAYSTQDFNLKLESEIKNDSEVRRNSRIKKAHQNSWKNKATEFEAILYKYAG